MVWDLVVFKGEVGIEEVGEEERDWDEEEESDEKSRSSENSEPLRPANTPDKVSATDCAEEWCALNRERCLHFLLARLVEVFPE